MTRVRGMRRLRRLAGRRRDRAPELSVVVPVYNVEQYVAACLDSVLAQSHADLEVVVVDDGATDDSAAIVERYAARDPRVRLLRQENQGLGAARNAGVAASRGRYLTFLDSDDVVPPDAYRAMMETLARTGSDLVVGTLREDHGTRQTTGRLMAANHRRRREGVILSDAPLLLADVFAQNKVYRRTFWEGAGLAFPVGTRYEDQPTLTRAFLAADRIDVLPDTVYLRRVRDDGSSITQTRHLMADLRDRLETKRDSTATLLAGRPDLAPVWFGTVLPVDMWEYFRAGATAEEEYWTLLRTMLTELWNDSTLPFEQTDVPAQQRLMGWLVEQDRRSDLVALLAFIEEVRRDFEVRIRDGEAVCVLPGLDDPAYGAPAEVYRLSEAELAWQARVLVARWEGPVLHLEGFALVRNLATGGRATALTARLEGPGGRTVELPVTPYSEPRATAAVGRARQDYDDCGFRVAVDTAALDLPPGGSAWRLKWERTVEGLSRTGGPTGYRAADVDRRARSVRPGVTAGLADVDGELVLEVRRD